MASGSGWNQWVWVESMGLASWCGCKEVYKFPHITYPYSSCICYFFASTSLLFVHLKKKFSFLFRYFFVIKFYALNNFFAQYKQTYQRIRASHGSHRRAAHNVLYMKKLTQTNASYPAMDISRMPSRGRV